MSAVHQFVSHWYPRRQWVAGDRFLSWFLTVDAHPALQALATRYQQTVADLTSLDAVPPRWLHVTVQGVGNTVGADPTEVTEVLERLREVDAAAVTVTVGHVAFVELQRRPPQYVRRALDTVRFTDG